MKDLVATMTDADAVCCAPLLAGALSPEDADQLADLLKALADPVRLRLLSIIGATENGEACVCDLVDPVGRSQPTVSHHLGALVDAGLLARQKRGRWVWYSVRPEALASLRAVLA